MYAQSDSVFRLLFKASMPLRDERCVLQDRRQGINSHGIVVTALECLFEWMLDGKREERSFIVGISRGIDWYRGLTDGYMTFRRHWRKNKQKHSIANKGIKKQSRERKNTNKHTNRQENRRDHEPKDTRAPDGLSQRFLNWWTLIRKSPPKFIPQI